MLSALRIRCGICIKDSILKVGKQGIFYFESRCLGSSCKTNPTFVFQVNGGSETPAVSAWRKPACQLCVRGTFTEGQSPSDKQEDAWQFSTVYYGRRKEKARERKVERQEEGDELPPPW